MPGRGEGEELQYTIQSLPSLSAEEVPHPLLTLADGACVLVVAAVVEAVLGGVVALRQSLLIPQAQHGVQVDWLRLVPPAQLPAAQGLRCTDIAWGGEEGEEGEGEGGKEGRENGALLTEDRPPQLR